MSLFRYTIPLIASRVSYRYSAFNALDLTSLSWLECEPMEHAIESPGVAATGKVILVTGGKTDEGWSAHTCKYDTEAGEWTKCQDILPTGNSSRSIVAFGRQVFVLHGDVFMQYDVAQDQWSELHAPLKTYKNCALVLHQGCLVALGGYGSNRGRRKDKVQTYDLTSKKWSIDNRTLPLGLVYHHAAVVEILQTL